MRIMLLVNEFPPEKIAGTAMATRALAEHLAAQGHQVLVVVTTSCPEAKQHLIAAGGYQLVWMQPRPLRGTGLAWRIWQAWRAARLFKPQIIQGQAVSCGLIAAVVGRLMHVPSICYAQGYDVYQSTPWQQRTEIRWGCLLPDKLLAVTRHLAGEVRRVTGAHDVQVLPHAFAMPAQQVNRQQARARCGIKGKQRLVFCVGRLESFKGHDVLLDAWPEFARMNPEARLCIAGSGSLLQGLQQQVARLGIGNSVQFAGHQPEEKIHQWMEAADLFVLPSRSEPFGIVLLEAMAHGLPVIASHVGGIPEVVPEQGDVQLLPPDDAAGLTQAMLSMFAEGFASSEVNRQHAMEFEWGLHVGRYESIYESLLK